MHVILPQSLLQLCTPSTSVRWGETCLLPGNKQVVPPASSRKPDARYTPGWAVPDLPHVRIHMLSQSSKGVPVRHQPAKHHRRRRCKGPQVAIPGHGHQHLPHLAAGLSRWLHHEPRTSVPAPLPHHRAGTPSSNPRRASRRRVPQASTHPAGSDTHRRRECQGFPQHGVARSCRGKRRARLMR